MRAFISGFICGALAAYAIVFALAFLGGCVVSSGTPSDDVPHGTGYVYVCASATDRGEWCWDGTRYTLADELGEGWTCQPTQRHEGPCLYCTGGRGCNAFNGCWGCQ